MTLWNYTIAFNWLGIFGWRRESNWVFSSDIYLNVNFTQKLSFILPFFKKLGNFTSSFDGEMPFRQQSIGNLWMACSVTEQLILGEMLHQNSALVTSSESWHLSGFLLYFLGRCHRHPLCFSSPLGATVSFMPCSTDKMHVTHPKGCVFFLWIPITNQQLSHAFKFSFRDS